MVIFHCYVSSPEGINNERHDTTIQSIYAAVISNLPQSFLEFQMAYLLILNQIMTSCGSPNLISGFSGSCVALIHWKFLGTHIRLWITIITLMIIVKSVIY